MRGRRQGLGQASWRAGGVAAVGVLGVVVACSGSEAARDRLVEYVEGDWSCDLTFAGAGPGGSLPVQATIEAEDDTRGQVTFVLDAAFGRTEYQGQWRRDGGSLEVDLAGSSYSIDGMGLDTDEVTILEAFAAAELQTVAVERDGDHVTLSWPDPWTGDNVEMPCTKG